MSGPAQHYLTYGLQAARESTDTRAALLVVSILSDMAQHMRWLGRPSAALRLHDLAMAQIPADRSRFNVIRAVMASKRAENGLANLGTSCLPEIRNATSMAQGLHAHASDEDRATAPQLWHRAQDMSTSHLSSMAGAAYLVLARGDSSLAAEAERYTLAHLSEVPSAQGRNRVFSHIRLASIRFVMGEPEQACADADLALTLAADQSSSMISTRLRELLADSERYAHLPEVADLQEQLRNHISNV
jgi:hypothetical protein